MKNNIEDNIVRKRVRIRLTDEEYRLLQKLKNKKNIYKITVHILYNQILKITKNHQNILVKSMSYKDNFSIMLKLQNLPRFFDFLRFCSFNIIFPFFLQIFCL